jgi:hypothetical protein
MGVIKGKYTSRILISLIIFIGYFFTTAQPIPVETIMVPRWLSSLESNYPVYFDGTAPAQTGELADSAENTAGQSQDALVQAAETEGREPQREPQNSPAGTPVDTPTGSGAEFLLPFELGTRFGYVDPEGRYVINREREGYLSISENHWAEYKAQAETIEVMDPRNKLVAKLTEPRGYPLFLDNRLFIINEEQNALTAVDEAGEKIWSYDFASLITDIDAAAGLILIGFLDGTVELLNNQGKRVFFFEPGGSRLSVICACRISHDGTKLAVISGYDDQRFLLLEKSSDSYKVIYHEFLSGGFRRAVHLAFIDNDRRVVFEREGGLEIYDIAGRTNVKVNLDGKINALDNSGEDNLLFVITSQSELRKELVGIRLPGEIIMEAPFKSRNAFLGRKGERLYVGGGNVIAAFELHRR